MMFFIFEMMLKKCERTDSHNESKTRLIGLSCFLLSLVDYAKEPVFQTIPEVLCAISMPALRKRTIVTRDS